MKLIEANIKNFSGKFKKSLDYAKDMCDVYKNDTRAIDNPEALSELWEMIESCEYDLESVKKLYTDMNKWYTEHEVGYNTMLAYTLQSVWGSVGLIKIQLEQENGKDRL